ARGVELPVALHGLGDVDGAVLAPRRVVQLAERRVPGARAVPRVRRLLRHLVAALVDPYAPGRLEEREQRGQGGAHDSSADQRDVDLFGGTGGALVVRSHARNDSGLVKSGTSAVARIT